MRSLPRILLLCEFPELNGAEQSLLAAAGTGAQGEFDFLAAVPPAGPLAQALDRQGIERIEFQTRDATGHAANLASRRQQLADLLARTQPDLLHANSISMGRLSGPVAQELGLASLTHLRDILTLSRQAVADLNLHRRLLAVLEATRRFHVAQGIDPGRAAVLYNGVDLDRFCPRPAASSLYDELNLPRSAVLVGTIGQIGLRKGQDILLQAACLLAGTRPDVHYLLVGRRCSQKDESRQFEADLRRVAVGPLAGRVHFLGLRDDVARILNELTLLVHPARQEPLGRVLLEAAASGAPVIATTVGGTLEIFPPGSNTARLIPADNAPALAQAMSDLLADASARLALGQAARRRAEQAFSAPLAAAALHQHYREVLDAR